MQYLLIRNGRITRAGTDKGEYKDSFLQRTRQLAQ